VNDRYLSIYLNDHLAGSTGGRQVAARALDQNREGALGDFLRVLVGEIDEDREVLIRLMGLLGIRRDPVKVGVVWAAERIGRVIKLNGHLLSYSPLSRVEELEFLSLGVEGKRLMWRALEALAETDDRLKGFDFATLIKRAEVQRDELERYRLEAVAEAR
jgi:hypothetical protein